MKTRKILATLIAFVLMASVVAFPTKTFANEEEPFGAGINLDYDFDWLNVEIFKKSILHTTEFEDGGTFWVEVNGSKIDGTWEHFRDDGSGGESSIDSQDVNEYTIGTGSDPNPNYDSATDSFLFYTDYTSDENAAIKVCYTSPTNITTTVVENFTFISMEEMGRLLNNPLIKGMSDIRARAITPAYEENPIQVKQLTFPGSLSNDYPEHEIFIQLRNEMMRGKGHSQIPLALFVDITMEPGPDFTGGPVDISLGIPGMKKGMKAEVWHFTNMGKFVKEEVEVEDGAIVMRGLTSLSPFLIYADVTADVPETGDSSNMIPYGIMGAIAIAGVGFIALRKRVNS